METTELKGREVHKITDTETVRDYDKESKMKGKKYRIFSYKDKGFIVNEDSKFNTLRLDGKIWSVELGTNEEGKLTLLNYITTSQEQSVREMEAKFKAIDLSVVKLAENFTPEELAV